MIETPIRTARHEAKEALTEAHQLIDTAYASLRGYPGLNKEQYIELLDRAQDAVTALSTFAWSDVQESITKARSLMNGVDLEARRQEKAAEAQEYVEGGASEAEAFANGEQSYTPEELQQGGPIAQSVGNFMQEHGVEKLTFVEEEGGEVEEQS